VRTGRAATPPGFRSTRQPDQRALNLALNARAAMRRAATLTFSIGRRRFDTADPDGLTPGDYVEISVADTAPACPRKWSTGRLSPSSPPRRSARAAGSAFPWSTASPASRAAPPSSPARSARAPRSASCCRRRRPAWRRPRRRPPRRRARGRRRLSGPRAAGRGRRRGARLDRRLLETLGCEVIEAAAAAPALAALAEDAAIGLVLSDVILPGETTGVELAKGRRGAPPALKIILMSGYPERSFRKNGAPEIPFPLLRKPSRAPNSPGPDRRPGHPRRRGGLTPAPFPSPPHPSPSPPRRRGSRARRLGARRGLSGFPPTRE